MCKKDVKIYFIGVKKRLVWVVLDIEGDTWQRQCNRWRNRNVNLQLLSIYAMHALFRLNYLRFVNCFALSATLVNTCSTLCSMWLSCSCMENFRFLFSIVVGLYIFWRTYFSKMWLWECTTQLIAESNQQSPKIPVKI